MLNLDKPFALIKKQDVITAYQGTLHTLEKIADIGTLANQQQSDVVFVLPYCTIKERGFEAKGNLPILALAVESTTILTVDDLTILADNTPISLVSDVVPSINDADYAALVARFQSQAIEQGHCSQATISRQFWGQLEGFSTKQAIALYKNLMQQQGHYMTVLFVHADGCLLAGTPERHLEIANDKAVMTPIAGTFRKLDSVPFDDFIADPKEVNELFQVVDEEMKMMGVICPTGGVVAGPYLHEFGVVVHSEYNLVGTRHMPALAALKQSLHAPTVMGAPLKSAARQIALFEPHERRYYAGEVGIYQPQGDNLDCAILIRGAEIFNDGKFVVQAGGGIVRDSDPQMEARESWAKAAGILNCLTGKHVKAPALQATPHQLSAFEQRNSQLSSFWRFNQTARTPKFLEHTCVTIINNEDDFVFMIAHMCRFLGLTNLEVVDSLDFDPTTNQSDCVIIGPGPGDPNDKHCPRMVHLRQVIPQLKAQGRKLFGICLGHQLLALNNNLVVVRQASSTQGMPRQVMVRGQLKNLAFYNSFSPVFEQSLVAIDVDIDDDKRVIAMWAYDKTMVGYQFHPESVMSVDGLEMMINAFNYLGLA
jgi:2-amino-4-deoxychorismate synthase